MSSEEANETELYCICRSSDVNRFMIGCDHCEEWYHGDCINVNEREAKYIKKYYCKICIGKNSKLQVVYKSKYKETERSGTTSIVHSKHKDKDPSKTLHEKHRDKHEIYTKSKSSDREKSRDKDRSLSKEKHRKYREEHSSKHGHRKHHYRDKEHEDKEKRRRDKEKHGNDKHDKDSERDRKKEKERKQNPDISHGKKDTSPGLHGGEVKSESVKDVGKMSVLKKGDGFIVTSEKTNSQIPSTEKDKSSKQDIESILIRKELEPQSQTITCKTPIKQSAGSQITVQKYENADSKSVLNQTPTKKSSYDKDATNNHRLTSQKNSSNKNNVLKELKNIRETDESAALDIAIKSDDDYEQDSDERWSKQPTKSTKKSKIKEAKKRTKSPINKELSKTNKKRRFIESAKSRKTKRAFNGDSSDDEKNDAHFSTTNDISELRQCFGHKCVKPARASSNYCSDECGINLASHRIVQTLPDRLREWNLTQCAADARNQKDLEKIRGQQNAVKSRLEQLNVDFNSLEELIERGKLQPIESEKEDEDDGGDTESAEMTVYCVTCGQDLHTKIAIRHMERCYNKFESQTSFASKFKTQIENHRMFCDFYNPKDETYCKRLQVLCPEHNPDPKFHDDEVCGYPIQKKIFAKPSEFCRLSKKRCQPHVFWEKLRRAEIDMERVRQWMKVDELLEQERAVKASMSSRAGVLGLLLHSTFNHELDDRFKAAQQLADAQRAQLAAQTKAKQAAQIMAANQAKLVAKHTGVKNSGNSASHITGVNVLANQVQNQTTASLTEF